MVQRIRPISVRKTMHALITKTDETTWEQHAVGCCEIQGIVATTPGAMILFRSILAAIAMTLKISRVLAASIVLAFAASTRVHAQLLCPADRPCFTASYQSGTDIVFEFNGVGTGFDFYNIRYPKDGGVKQVENRSGRFTFRNVRPNSVYTLSVQGCNKSAFTRSSCSPWVSESVTTR